VGFEAAVPVIWRPAHRHYAQKTGAGVRLGNTSQAVICIPTLATRKRESIFNNPVNLGEAGSKWIDRTAGWMRQRAAHVSGSKLNHGRVF
jgi:hypothetical protein